MQVLAVKFNAAYLLKFAAMSELRIYVDRQCVGRSNGKKRNCGVFSIVQRFRFTAHEIIIQPNVHQ